MAKKKTDKVRPQVLKGFRDYPPPEQIAREKMIGNVRSAVELMGFLPLQTASLELAETLLGQHYTEDNLSELFGFVGPDEVKMALRYEFTVSLARYVAANPNLALPFRRYQYGNVWRVDKPGPGRYREFMQFDIDIVGTTNILADAEIIATMVAVFDELGINNYKVKYSSRKIMNGLIKFAGIDDDKAADVMRVVDKLDKQGKKAVIAELGAGRTDRSGDKIKGVGLTDKQIAEIEKFLDAASGSGNALDTAESLLGSVEVSAAGISDLKAIESHLSSMNIDKSKTEIDLTIVRGLAYYTGPVFETTLLDLPEFGSVFSGGRYDNLVSRFTGQKISGTGASIGVDRLLAALIELKTLKLEQSISKVLVTVMDPERLPDYLKMLYKIREAGIPSEIFVGDSKNITKQVKYADKVGIPFVVIAGSDEFAAGQVTIKNLKAGQEKAKETSDREEWLKAEEIQVTIAADKMVEYLKGELGEQKQLPILVSDIGEEVIALGLKPQNFREVKIPYNGKDDYLRIIIEVIAPLIEELERKKLIDGFHYIMHQELDLRISIPYHENVQEVDDVLKTRSLSSFNRPWTMENSEPEHYGGEIGVHLIYEYLEFWSRLIIKLLKAEKLIDSEFKEPIKSQVSKGLKRLTSNVVHYTYLQQGIGNVEQVNQSLIDTANWVETVRRNFLRSNPSQETAQKINTFSDETLQFIMNALQRFSSIFK